MSFEFKKAFEKATERRALTFNQQWAMSDIGKNKSLIGLVLTLAAKAVIANCALLT